jgi:hypothetical protein
MRAPDTPSARFSEQTLADLLNALRARAVSRPDNPGLVAVTIAGWQGGKSRTGWALGDSELTRS